MADRVVNVRLRLDTTQYQQGSRQAEQANQQMARSAQRAATQAGGTFSNVSRQAQGSLTEIQRAAARSSQALANGAQAMSRQTAQSAVRASQATRQVVAETGRIPAAFRAAGGAGASSMRSLEQQALAGRAALQGTVRAAVQVQTAMSEVTLRGATGASQLSLANRLALAEVTQASRVATEAAARNAARVSTSQALAAGGARRASEASAAAMARANARAAAASTGSFARVAARASAMGSSIAASAARSERSLKATRTVSLALVAAFGLAVYASTKFEKAMSGVKAATQAGAAELSKLRAAAISAGRTTQYSATQAAAGEMELAKAGVSTSDILGGALKGTLNLAAAGQMDVADSAVVAAKAMNSFGLKGSDMAHIADVIAAAAGKSATDVHGMSLAFAQSSLLAHQTGLTLEQTAGSLALFAQNGLVGSDAGTSLKTMLLRLTPQSKEAAAMMDRLGFSAYDSKGNFVGLSETAARMQKAFGKLTPEARNAAMSTIFGSDAARAATVVYKAGASGINTWTKAANDQGYASRYAATQTDNLAGDLQKLKSSLETAFIEGGSAATGMLRGITQSLTTILNWYSKLPAPIQKSTLVIAGMAGAIGLIGTSLLLAMPRIRVMRTELQMLGVTAGRTRTAMMGLGRLTLVVAGLEAASIASTKLTEAMKAAPPNATKLTAELVKLAQSSKATAAGVTELDNFGAAVQRIAHPDGLTKVTDAMGKIPLIGGEAGSLSEAKDKLKALDDALTSLVQSGSSDVAAQAFAKMAAAANASGTSTEKLKTLLPGYADALTGVDTQSKLAADGQKSLGDSADTTAAALQDQRTEAEKLTDALNALNGVNISAAEGQISFRQSLADLSKAAKDNGHSLDVTTDKGRKVKSAFLDAAKAAQSHAQAVTEQKNSVSAGNKVLEQDIAALKHTMRQAGFSEKAIKDLTKAYAQLPPKTSTQIKADTKDALHDLEAVQGKVRGTKGKTVEVKALTSAGQKALESLGFKIKRTKGKNVTITVPTGTQKKNVDALGASINRLHSKSVTLSVSRVTHIKTYSEAIALAKKQKNSANGNIFSAYADGGMRERHVAQIAGAGTYRVWAEPETGGEAYIPFAASKRPRSRAIAEETVRRLGGKGIAWYASGGMNGFTYSPSGAPALGGPGDAKQRYDKLVDQLKQAWKALSAAMEDARKKARNLHDAEDNLKRVRSHHHTEAQLAAAEKKLRDAREASNKANKKVAADRKTVNSLDTSLGLKKGSKAPAGFNLKAYQKQLGKSVAATEKWQANLNKISKRGGAEIEGILEGMGEDGYALVNALAGASDKQFKDITKKLLKTAGIAKATLADFNKQVNASTKVNTQFAADLQKLAAMGYGDLAQALAAQGDAAAQTLAHEAAGSSAKASKANTAVKKNEATLTGDDLTNALTLISTLRAAPGRGYADLIAAGLDTATIKALVPKISKQIGALPAQYKDTFVQQWVQQGGVAMARGGILNRPTAVLGGEAGVRESWIPWDGSSRSRSLMAATASAAGYQLVPAGRFASTGASTAALAQEVSKQVTIHLYGAKQSSAEQAQDIARHLNFVG